MILSKHGCTNRIQDMKTFIASIPALDGHGRKKRYGISVWLAQSWWAIQRLVRKIDWKITVWAVVAYFALNLDRSNLSQANTDNFLEDLNMTTNGLWHIPFRHQKISPRLQTIILETQSSRLHSCYPIFPLNLWARRSVRSPYVSIVAKGFSDHDRSGSLGSHSNDLMEYSCSFPILVIKQSSLLDCSCIAWNAARGIRPSCCSLFGIITPKRP